MAYDAGSAVYLVDLDFCQKDEKGETKQEYTKQSFDVIEQFLTLKSRLFEFHILEQSKKMDLQGFKN